MSEDLVPTTNKTIALVGAIAAIMLVLAAFGYALVANRPLDSFAPTLIAFAAPTITTLLTGAGFLRKLGSVEEKVNGNYHTLVGENVELRTTLTQLLAAMPTDLTARVINTGAIPVVTQDDYKNEGKHRA